MACCQSLSKVLFSSLGALLLSASLCFAELREPVWAGAFYPAEPEKLLAAIQGYEARAKTVRKDLGKRELKAIVLPHAGYVYSGWTASHGSLLIRNKKWEKVVLMGPDHRVGIRNGVISAVDGYQTPLGIIPLHRDATRLRRNSGLFTASPESDRTEHSLEVLLPFLQTWLHEFSLVPIVMGSGDAQGMAAAISEFVDERTLVAVSSDLSHYLPYDEAVRTDAQTINHILRGNRRALAQNRNSACGLMPLLVLMAVAEKRNWQPILLHYSNSGDTAGSRDKVVGYATIAYFGGDEMTDAGGDSQGFTSEQGQVLVRLARMTISEQLGLHPPEEERAEIEQLLNDQIYQRSNGTFVTLKIQGQLRGCIGNLSASGPVADGVRRNALSAAFQDYRFTPLTAMELEKVHMEVSVLTEPVPLDYNGAQDLLAKLRVKEDGVILRKGSASATFLPQVWEQLPAKEIFLSQLCRKAGLSTDAWMEGDLEISTYQVQYFEE